MTPCRTDVTVHVKVIDRSMPVFKKQFYSEVIPENMELHSPLTVSIEAESPLSRKLIYSIIKGNELEEFALDFNTGGCLTHITSMSLFRNVSIDLRTDNHMIIRDLPLFLQSFLSSSVPGTIGLSI